MEPVQYRDYLTTLFTFLQEEDITRWEVVLFSFIWTKGWFGPQKNEQEWNQLTKKKD